MLVRINSKTIHKVLKRILIVWLTTSTLQGFSQSWEVGAMAGGSNYHGDLAYNIVPQNTHFSGGAFFKYNFNGYWAMRPTISYMKISGADSNFSEYKLRNLSFRNNIYELSNIVEFNFQPFSTKSIHKSSTFYVLTGLALFLHKPEAELDGQWHDLRALKTEGKDYKLMQLSIPMGAGYKHALTKNLVMGFEVGFRRTFTDHLDDVSTVYPDMTTGGPEFLKLADRSWEVSPDGRRHSNQGDMRGDPNLKDWYFQTAFSFSYRFTPIQCAFKRINFFE